MLRDTLAEPRAGHHVEQVEIVFTPSITQEKIVAAWQETVRRTAALQLSFTFENEQPHGWEFVTPPTLLYSDECSTGTLESWLVADQLSPLVTPSAVPWRAVYWPATRRLVWTFHHALLDGRSIARILRSFFAHFTGPCPEPLTLARWQPPTADAVIQAGKLFAAPIPQTMGSPLEEADATPAICRLEPIAVNREVTAATLVTWAWGRAILAASGNEAVWIEQLRAGAPQSQTAGFTMNLLPVLIRAETSPHELQRQLHALRTIETVSPQDFSPGVFPATDGPWASVIMVERGCLRQMAHAPDFIETLRLHERPGKSLAATAHLSPDLRLQVEGPGRHHLLAKWIDLLKNPVT